MCGFVVRAGFDTPWSDEFLDTLRSRGPDGAGFWHDNDIDIGHALLSNIGTHQEGAQPKANERYVLSLNGLVTNHRELAIGLQSKNSAALNNMPAANDTSTLLTLWSDRCEAILPDLVGFWAFAVYDRSARILTLVRDQFGAKPLYYWSDGRRFCAASTIRSLLQVMGFVPELDYKAMAEYARYQLSFGENTFFCGIRRVLPGHLVRFKLSNGDISKHCWEDIFAPADPLNGSSHGTSTGNGFKTGIPDERWIEETRELLETGIRQNTLGRRPWTVLTSGGIDSTIVTRITQPTEAFHSFFTNPGCNELDFARVAINDTSSRLIEVQASEKFNLVERLGSIIEDFDDPSVGSVILPLDELLTRVARKHHVVLTGTGGDELFGGYARYSLAQGRGAQASYAKLMRRMAKRARLADRFEMAHHKGECGWFRFDTRPAEAAFASAFDACISPYLTGAEAELDAMLRFDRRHFLPGLLNIDDRISGRHGIESRPALLSQHFVRKITGVPIQAIFNEGPMKGLLRHLGAPYLPQPICQRDDKMGFTTPIGTFVQQSSDSIIQQLRESPFRHLYALPKGPLPAHEIYSREVFGLLMMDLWLNRYAAAV